MKKKAITQGQKEYFEGVENDIVTYQIKHLYTDWNNKEITVPSFQRNYEYDITQKISVINSILMNISLDTFSVVKPYQSTEKILCDGFHRLRTIVDFLDDKFPYNSSLCNDTLRWFTKTESFDTRELNGRYFSQFPRLVQQHIKEYRISVCEISIKHPEVNKKKVIAFLMEQKNSCSSPMSKKRMKLNRVFIMQENLLNSWERLNKEFTIKSGRDNVLSKAINNDTTAETFSYALKFLKYNQDLVEVMIDKILSYAKRFNPVNKNLNSVGHFIKKLIVVMAVQSYTKCNDAELHYILRIYDKLESLTKESNTKASMSSNNLFYFFTNIYGLDNSFASSRVTENKICIQTRLNLYIKENKDVSNSILRVKAGYTSYLSKRQQVSLFNQPTINKH